MNKKKVVILGIDALEYNLVEEWNLKHLKQTEYGKTVVPMIKGWKEPATVIVWPCMITGVEPEEMGFTTPILFVQPFKWFFEYIHRPIRDFIFRHKYVEEVSDKKTSQEVLNVFKDVTKNAGLTRPPSKKDIKASTIFDNNKFKSVHLHIPVYDEELDTLERWVIFDVMDKKMKTSDFVDKYEQEFKERTQEVMTILKKDNWDLFMTYFYCLDPIQHALFNKKLTIMNWYLKFNEFVGNLKKKLPKDTILLIVSDHGQEKGIHTTYGFYSCNKKLGLENPKIIEFNENDLIRNSKKILNYSEGIRNMVNRSKGVGSNRDIKKMLNHLELIEKLSSGESKIIGYVKTMQEKVEILKTIHISKERIPIILDIGKINDSLIEVIKPYARR